MPIDIDKQSRTFGGKRQLKEFNNPNQRINVNRKTADSSFT